MSKIVTISKFHRQGLRAERDRRHFVICPKCQSDETNFIAIMERISKFKGRTKLKQKVVTNQNKGLTVCRNCGYNEGSL